MKKVISKDGTSIAFDQYGAGPVVILVDGALGYRKHWMNEQLAAHLAHHFTVINYDRRGHGDSGDTLPYAVEREIEDIDALIDAAGGAAYLYGLSSGAILALEAASKLPPKVKKLALYEPPFIIDDSRPPLPADYVEHLNDLIAQGRRGTAVDYFMTAALLIPEEYLEPMHSDPTWPEMEAIAHTIAYDGTFVRDFLAGKPLPAKRWLSATMPTFVIVGGNSEPFFHDGAKSLVSLLSDAQYRVLEGQDHGVAPEALAPLLVESLRA